MCPFLATYWLCFAAVSLLSGRLLFLSQSQRLSQRLAPAPGLNRFTLTLSVRLAMNDSLCPALFWWLTEFVQFGANI